MLTAIDHDPVQESLAGQAADFAELSRTYAAGGDGRRAALAAWASDVRAVQALVLETGADARGRPPPVPLAVETALAGLAAVDTASVRTVVETARAQLVGTFDASVHDQVRGRLAALDHLDAVAAPGPGAANRAVTDRLDGRGGEQLVGDLLTAAADCRAVAQVMAQVGDEDERQRQTDAADLAGFEAFLVLVSAATGDATLATTELRWDLAAVKLGAAAGRPRAARCRRATCAWRCAPRSCRASRRRSPRCSTSATRARDG